MKKVAIVTAAVLALGLAASNNNPADTTPPTRPRSRTLLRPTSTLPARRRRPMPTPRSNAAANAVDDAGNAVDNAQAVENK